MKRLLILLFFAANFSYGQLTTNTQTIQFDNRIRTSVGIVELSEDLGDFSRLTITQDGGNVSSFKNMNITYPVLITPSGEMTIVNASAQVGDALWKFVLESLVKEGRGRLINETFLVINDKENGTINASSREPYQSYKVIGNVEQFVTEFLDVGTKVILKPAKLNNSLVTINVDFEISEILSVAKTNNSDIPVISVRKIQTQIFLQPNEYVIIGGLDQEKTTELINGVPFFRRIPWIGTLFTSREQKTSRTKLYIIIHASTIENDDSRRYLEIKEQNEKGNKPQGIMGKYR